MIVSSPTAELLAVCQKLQAVTPNRPNMPVYQNAKAVAEADRLVLMATDLEVGLRCEIAGVAVEDGGEAILPLRRLTAILGASPDSEVRLDADAKRVKVTTASSGYELPTEDPASF